MTFSLERKKTDFHHGSAVTAYTGSGCCCCCCCLHWIGALVGGGVGMRKAWLTQTETTARPLHATVRSRFLLAIVVGFFLNALPLLALPFRQSPYKEFPNALAGWVYDLGAGTLAVMAFAPLLVFLPPAIFSLASALRLRRQLTRSYLAEMAKPEPSLPSEGSAYRHPTEHTQAIARDLAALDHFEVCCNHCWTPMGEGVFVTRCPSCDTPIDRPLFRQADDGVALAKRMIWTSMFGAFLGTAAGYLVMSLWLIGK